MLILARKPLEWIDLRLPDGQLISVQVVRAGRDSVRLGIEADRAIQIARREIRCEVSQEPPVPLPSAS